MAPERLSRDARRSFPRIALAFLAVLSGGCGVSGTAATAAAGGASEAEQAKQARATEERVKRELDAAAQADAQRREAAEAANQ